MSYGLTQEQRNLMQIMSGAIRTISDHERRKPMIPVKIKRLHPDAVIPQYATDGSAGFDLVAVEDVIIAPGETKKVPLGLAFEIPEGYVMNVCMRSGIALKTKLRQSNGIGVIDSDYRGEVAMMFDNTAEPKYHAGIEYYEDGDISDVLIGRDHDRGVLEMSGKFIPSYELGNSRIIGNNTAHFPTGTYLIRKGDRICQGIIAKIPKAIFVESEGLSETWRGGGGFGSTNDR